MTAQTAEKRDARVPTYVDMARLCFELSITERTADAWVTKGIIPPPIDRGGKRLWKFSKVEAALDGAATDVAPSADEEARRVQDATKRAAHARH